MTNEKTSLALIVSAVLHEQMLGAGPPQALEWHMARGLSEKIAGAIGGTRPGIDATQGTDVRQTHPHSYTIEAHGLIASQMRKMQVDTGSRCIADVVDLALLLLAYRIADGGAIPRQAVWLLRTAMAQEYTVTGNPAYDNCRRLLGELLDNRGAGMFPEQSPATWAWPPSMGSKT